MLILPLGLRDFSILSRRGTLLKAECSPINSVAQRLSPPACDLPLGSAPIRSSYCTSLNHPAEKQSASPPKSSNDSRMRWHSPWILDGLQVE
jgi:hypothetical protein